MVELRPTDAEARGTLAEAYLQAGQTNEGVAELRKGAELARGTALEHKLLAMAEKAAGNWRKAIAHLQQAREIPPPDLWVHYWLAMAHKALSEDAQALAAIDRGLELALRPSDESAGPSPPRTRWRGIAAPAHTSHALPNFYQVRGEIYLKQKNYKAAVAEFNNVYNVNILGRSYDTSIYKRRALAYFHLGHYEQALADLVRAVELKSDDFSILIWISPDLVASCPDEKFRAGVLALADKAIERTHGKAEGYTARGLLYAALKQYDKAEADYSKAIQAATDEKERIEVYQCRYGLRLALECTEQARQDQEQIIQLLEQWLERSKAKLSLDHPDILQGLYNLAAAYQEAGKLDQAERLRRDLLHRHRKKNGPQSAETSGVLAYLGLNLLQQQRYAEAEPLLRECLTIREQQLADSWLRFNSLSLLGWALLGQQNYAAAEPLLLQGYEGIKQRVDQIPPLGKQRLTEAIERLVRLYEETGQAEKAHAWRERLPPAKAPGRKE
jgi:tetratricopeptide (TPR) repeat protein